MHGRAWRLACQAGGFRRLVPPPVWSSIYYLEVFTSAKGYWSPFYRTGRGPQTGGGGARGAAGGHGQGRRGGAGSRPAPCALLAVQRCCCRCHCCCRCLCSSSCSSSSPSPRSGPRGRAAARAPAQRAAAAGERAALRAELDAAAAMRATLAQELATVRPEPAHGRCVVTPSVVNAVLLDRRSHTVEPECKV